MPGNYIDTPERTALEHTSLSPQKLEMSFHQPFQSPSKNPKEDIMAQMRGAGAGMRTPRVRQALVNGANRAKRQEFTPLLKSAKRNQLLRSVVEDKENDDDGRPHSFARLQRNANVLIAPQALHSSYSSLSGGSAGRLPMDSSMIDAGDATSSSTGMGEGTPMVPQQASSSMLDSTPIPSRTADGAHGAGVLEQGNMLSLRDQRRSSIRSARTTSI